MSSLVRITVVQTDPKLGAVQENLRGIVQAIAGAPGRLVVFPECALSGYGFGSAEEGLAHAQPIPGPATEAVAEACRRANAHVVFGLLERDGDRLYNSAALVGPAGLIGRYRKMHLPYLGVDRFATRGDQGFPVFATPVGRLGILICYDLSFPEAARSLKLGGAQVLIVPTNWPEAARVSCEHSPPVRSQENHFHVVTANRVGSESGFTFRGGSSIHDCDGRLLARATSGAESISADVSPGLSDANRIVIVPGEYELDRVGHRRPEHYGMVTAPLPPA